MSKGVNAVLSIVVALAVMFGSVGVLRAAGDIRGHWAEDSILLWQQQGLARGYSDGNFLPDRAVSRAEFVAFLNRAYPLPAGGEHPGFFDVNEDDWFYEDVIAAAEAGLIVGEPGGAFNPGRAISRQETAAVLHRLLVFLGIYRVSFEVVDEEGQALDKALVEVHELSNMTDEYGLAHFHDFAAGETTYQVTLAGFEPGHGSLMVGIVPEQPGPFADHNQIAKWAEEAVSVVTASGLVLGYPDGYFRPLDYVTRAETITILERALMATDTVMTSVTLDKAETGPRRIARRPRPAVHASIDPTLLQIDLADDPGTISSSFNTSITWNDASEVTAVRWAGHLLNYVIDGQVLHIDPTIPLSDAECGDSLQISIEFDVGDDAVLMVEVIDTTPRLHQYGIAVTHADDYFTSDSLTDPGDDDFVSMPAAQVSIVVTETRDIPYDGMVRIAPVGAEGIQLWAKDTAGTWHDINLVGWGPASGFPIDLTAVTSVYVVAEEGVHTFTVELVDVTGDYGAVDDIVASAEVTVDVRTPQYHEYGIAVDHADLYVSSQPLVQPTDADFDDMEPAEVSIVIAETRDFAYDGMVRIAPVGADHIQLWARDTSDNWHDINLVGWGPASGFPIDLTAVTSVYVVAEEGVHNFTVELVDVTGDYGAVDDVVASAEVTVDVRTPQYHEYGIAVDHADSYLSSQPLVQPTDADFDDMEPAEVSIVIAETRDISYDGMVRIAPVGADDIQLWARDTSDNWHDINVAGWGPSSGFPIDLTAVTNVYVVAEEGVHNFTVELVDVTGDYGAVDDIVASAEVTVDVMATFYTVTFCGNGGTPQTTEVQVVENGTVDSLPTVTRDGYSFSEWNASSDGTGEEFTKATQVTQDLTVYAIWSETGVVFAEDFSGLSVGAIPEGWERTGDKWGAANASTAGGTAPEMRYRDPMNPHPVFDYRVWTPEIDATGLDSLQLTFTHFAERYHHAGWHGLLKVQVSVDGGSWVDVWSVTTTTSIGPEVVNINLDNYAGEAFRIGWSFSNYPEDINHWSMDDVVVSGH